MCIFGMQTRTVSINKYNGVKVNENNFGEKNQVFYLYNVGGGGAITDPVANGLTLNFA